LEKYKKNIQKKNWNIFLRKNQFPPQKIDIIFFVKYQHRSTPVKNRSTFTNTRHQTQHHQHRPRNQNQNCPECSPNASFQLYLCKFEVSDTNTGPVRLFYDTAAYVNSWTINYCVSWYLETVAGFSQSRTTSYDSCILPLMLCV
jgi:hypothetical protein